MAIFTGACTGKSTDENSLERCVDILKTTLNSEAEWVKVHAAEYLLWASYPDGVKEEFLKEENDRGTQAPYRIGIWRVLAQASASEDERMFWVSKILQAFLDEQGADRVHAAETLAKLRVSPLNYDSSAVARVLNGSDSRLRSYTLWSVMFTSADSISSGGSAFLSTCVNADAQRSDKELAAYVLGRTAHLSLEQWRSLAIAALSETRGSTTRLYMLTGALMTCPAQRAESALYTKVRTALSDYESSKEPGILAELSYSLARNGNGGDTVFLRRLLNNEHETGSRSGDADVRAAAAFALIEIGKREASGVKNDR